jgi:hypothetical protein
MCRGVCLVVSRTGEIYNSETYISSHEKIIEENDIRDGLLENIVRIEMLPTGDLFSTERKDWECSIDEEDSPNWFLENKEELVDKCYNKLWSIISNWRLTNKIEGSLNLCDTKIKSLGNLEYVGGFLDLSASKIKTLGKLKTVKYWLDLYNTKIKSLGKLEYVGVSLDLENTPIKTLGKLKYIGDYLYINNPDIDMKGFELGNNDNT